jgi:phosphoribosylamine--glycine ligase
MNILVIGSGGREHAIVWKLRQSPQTAALYCAPGNPGIAPLATLVPLKADDYTGLAAFARRERIDLTIVGPEQPLAGGIVDLFEDLGLVVFGPTKAAAQLEWSKVFAKEFMRRHGIPTASYRVFTAGSLDAARTFLGECPLPVVLKADGLAAGKGVVICRERMAAVALMEDMVRHDAFGTAGRTVVVEEMMTGDEASVFALCDGTDFVTLAPAQDHKRVFDDDQGNNTGGMGAYAPAPLITPSLMRTIEDTIIRPTLEGMASEGRPYRGCLYVGIMVTAAGPKVVEYNCRFGDPETQVVLPVLGEDLIALLYAAARRSLGSLPNVQGHARLSGSAACVILASAGYPERYRSGFPITGLDEAEALPDVLVFHAGTGLAGGELVTAGGRVLGITAVDEQGDLSRAIAASYRGVGKVKFEGMHFRRDIGRKAFRS